MPRYVIESGLVLVSARSNIHDTETRWNAVAGFVDAEPGDLAAASADLRVDMTRHEAGDFLRNRKLRKDLQVERWPEARFRLARLGAIEARGDGRFAARAEGTIAWHGREVAIQASGEGELDAARLRAVARFEVDVRAFGVDPPRFLMFKVEEVVAVQVTLAGRAQG